MPIASVPDLAHAAWAVPETATFSMRDGGPSANTLVAHKGSIEIMVVSFADITAEKSLEQHLFAKID